MVIGMESKRVNIKINGKQREQSCKYLEVTTESKGK